MKTFLLSEKYTCVQFDGSNYGEINRDLNVGMATARPGLAVVEEARRLSGGRYIKGDEGEIWASSTNEWVGFKKGDWIVRSKLGRIERVRKADFAKRFTEVG
jgi:hypothetical protein